MADTTNNTAPAVWDHLLALRSDLLHSHNPDIDERLAAVEERLLGLPAPDIEGVALKLELLWEAELHGEDQDSERKLAILNDLHRLSA